MASPLTFYDDVRGLSGSASVTAGTAATATAANAVRVAVGAAAVVMVAGRYTTECIEAGNDVLLMIVLM